MAEVGGSNPSRAYQSPWPYLAISVQAFASAGPAGLYNENRGLGEVVRERENGDPTSNAESHPK